LPKRLPRGERAPSPRVRGEGWGEGAFPQTQNRLEDYWFQERAKAEQQIEEIMGR